MTPNPTACGPTARIAAAVAAALLSLPIVAGAAVPGSALVEGALTSASGGAAADGTYKLTFSLYKDESGGNPVWSEADVVIPVKGGLFAHALGSKSALTQQVLTDLGGKPWIALKIEGDPELPRKPLSSVVFALRAGAAEVLDCSGCIKAGHIDSAVLGPFAKTADLAKVAVSGDFADLKGGPDLSAYAKLALLADYAKLTALADYAKLTGLADVAKSGNYADLKGLPALAKIATTGEFADLKAPPVLAKLGASCGTGLVVKGLKADGSYECVVAMDPSAFPPDALDEVSNGLLFNQFQDTVAGTPNIAIQDGFLFGVADNLTFPDIGVAQKLNVSVHLQNSDVSFITVSVFDPAGTEHLLYDKGAKGTEIKTSYPNPTKQVAKDLGVWVGKNPKGTWTLKVVDSGAPTGVATDGKIVAWSVDIQTMSNAKVGVGGGLVLKNASDPPYACGATVAGSLYFDVKTKSVRYCDGANWRSLADTCGNGILDPNEQCDDGNNTTNDGCSATCVASVGFAAAKPGVSCKNVLALASAESVATKDGLYWIDPNGGAAGDAFQAWCDMTSDGGGWTLVARIVKNSRQHLHTKAYGAIPILPTQSKPAKLSDAVINSLKTNTQANGSGFSNAFRFHCGSTPVQYFPQGCTFNAPGSVPSGPCHDYATGATSQNYVGGYGDSNDCGLGGHHVDPQKSSYGWHTCGISDGTLDGVGEFQGQDSTTGCGHNQIFGTGQDGLLWVR